MNEYVIVFPSFYLAVYAQEKLQENRIKATLKKIPASMIRSCGYALYLYGDQLFTAKEILGKNNINWRAIYRVDKDKNQYRTV